MWLAGCAPQGEGTTDNCFGKCDHLGDGFLGSIEGRTDPIANWLRQSGIDDNGFVEAEYGDVLFGIAKDSGCGVQSSKTFVVSDDLVTGGEAFPRLVSTVCSDDATKASEFFISAAFEDFRNPGEMDRKSIEMFAWDATARKYRFYETFPTQGGKIRVDANPTRCMQCHLTTADIAPTAMRMTPIMNELTRPWTHWNADPGFPSFDFQVPDRAKAADSWADLVAPWLGQASELEVIIRAGHDRVAGARVRERRNPVDIEQAMGLLRPLFCPEQINYVSEDFDSGILFNTALVDPGTRLMYLQIRPDNWPWSWVNDQTIRLSAPSGDVLVQIPVRGNSDIAVENLLVATKVLTPQQVLRIRALDWKRPVFSEFRCGLWKEALVNFEFETPDLSGTTRISHAIPILFEAILTLGPRAITSGQEDTFIALQLAEAEQVGALFQRLGAGDVGQASCATDGFCVVDVDQFGALINTYVKGIESAPNARELILVERDRRICALMEQVKAVDDRFDDPRAQRSCAEDCCADAGNDGDDICIGQAAAAAQAFDTSTPIFQCAVNCAQPAKVTARPSLPFVEGCSMPSRFLP